MGEPYDRDGELTDAYEQCETCGGYGSVCIVFPGEDWEPRRMILDSCPDADCEDGYVPHVH